MRSPQSGGGCWGYLPIRAQPLGRHMLWRRRCRRPGYVLTQYPPSMVTFLLFFPEDCCLDWGDNIGRHCFGDYAIEETGRAGPILESGMAPTLPAGGNNAIYVVGLLSVGWARRDWG